MTPEHICHYYHASPHSGSFPESGSNVLFAMAGSLSAGEVMQLQVQTDGKHCILDARFKVYGCGYAIATCAYLCEWMIGQDLSAMQITAQSLIAALKLPSTKYHCAILGEDLIKALQKKYSD